MFTDYRMAAYYIQEHQVRMVDIKFCDLWGRWHHVTISAREFNPGFMAAGVGFDGSSVGFKSVKSGDMVLIPDLTTGFMDPFWDVPTLSFIGSAYEADSKAAYRNDPRQILRHAHQYLLSTGFGDDSLWGPEFEFYIFNKVSMENGMNMASYRLDTDEGEWNAATSGHGHHLPTHGGYHAIPPNDHMHNLRTRMSILLEEAGIPVKYHHHETGGPGQNEIETPLLSFQAAADAVMMVKYFTRMAAHQAGLTLTYLPKPLYGEAGSGMHFHQQLLLGGQNAFYDPGQPNLLSQTARWYIGGLLTHAPAVMAFTNPSTNSFRRLVPGFEAPINCFYSSGNRSAAIRVPKYATQPDKVRFEFRPPDGTCNPYLAMSAQLLAGLDGIQRHIDPAAAGFGPIDEDIFSWTPEERAKIKSLPVSLDETMRALELDHAFLTAHGVFEEVLIEEWIRTKRKEDNAMRARPHPYEIQQYYDL